LVEKGRLVGYGLAILGVYGAAAILLASRFIGGSSVDPFKWWLGGRLHPPPRSPADPLLVSSFIAYSLAFAGLVLLSLGKSKLGILMGLYGLSAHLLPDIAAWAASKYPQASVLLEAAKLLAPYYPSTPLMALGLGLATSTSAIVGAPLLLYALYDAVWDTLGLPAPSGMSMSIAGYNATVYEAILYYTGSALVIHLALVLRKHREQEVMEQPPIRIPSSTEPGSASEAYAPPRMAWREAAAVRSSVTAPPVVREGAGTGERREECSSVRLSEFAKNRREVAEKCLVGREIHGYVVEEFIGSGGFGVVLRAHAREDPGDKAAIKLLVPIPVGSGAGGTTSSRLVRDVLMVARDLEREALSLRELSEKSPYVVRLKAIHIDSERLAKAVRMDSFEIYMVSPPAIIMEYLGGGSLSKLLEEAKRLHVAGPDNRDWVRAVAALGAVIAKALAHVHGSGYVHGDLKPENILFTTRPAANPRLLASAFYEALLRPEHARTVPKLSDLGAAVRIGSPVMQLTPGYAAPELEAYDLVCNELGKRNSPICSKVPVAEPSQDIYSLGVILLQLLAGLEHRQVITLKHKLMCRLDEQRGLVCDTSKIERMLRDAPSQLRLLLGKMLSDNPRERPDASRVAACLACLAGNEPRKWSTCNEKCSYT
jgi:serine/threonine protein kinase